VTHRASTTPAERLTEVLLEARALVSRAGNDFSWSSWEDAADARREIDELVKRLEWGPVRTSSMAILFAPTGPMQEVAVSSGWAQDYVDLADRFDTIDMVAVHTWGCSVCERDAGSIELHENGELRRETFTGVLTERVRDPARFERIWDAIASGTAPGLFAVDAELAPWWCPECAACYCGEHWTRRDVFDEEEPALHDSIRGRCPQGHERMLED
jgi:hypothetical protein